MNVKLLEAVRDYIADHPKEYAQANWCGTQRCIAGHAVVLAGMISAVDISRMVDEVAQGKVQTLAQRALELDDVQAENLFLEWPDQFDAGWGAYGRSKAISAAVNRIDHFIKTNGAE